jgi:hypothetical protein
LEKISKPKYKKKLALQTLNNRIGHYSVQNVNKRDETAKKNLICYVMPKDSFCARENKVIMKMK